MLLGIDQGSTATTALLIDAASGATLARGRAPVATHRAPGGRVEHDALALWETVGRATREALAAAGANPRGIRALGIAAQRSTLVVWDVRSGVPLGPALSWQDTRAAAWCEAHAADAALIGARTGLPLDPGYTAPKLAWLREHDPDFRAAATAGTLKIGTVATFLLDRLCGGGVGSAHDSEAHDSEAHDSEAHGAPAFALDYTTASRTMLLDIERGAWDAELCALFGVRLGALPRIVAPAGVLGVTRGVFAPTGIPDGVPIAGLCGDQQAALVGHGGFHAGAQKCTYGTGAFVIGQLGARRARVPGLTDTLVVGPRPSDPRALSFGLEGHVLSCGTVLAWLTCVGIIADPEEADRLAASVPDAGGVTLVPALAGLGAPHARRDVPATLLGMTARTSRAQVVRAALEGIAHRVADIVEAMAPAATAEALRQPATAGAEPPASVEGVTDGEPRSLSVDGGLSASLPLCQIQAAWLGRDVCRLREREATARGAAALAALGAGVWPDVLTARTRLAGEAQLVPRPRDRATQATARAARERWLATITWLKSHPGRA